MSTGFIIAIAGALGVLLRHGIDHLFNSIIPTQFPYSTFLINIVGSFILGIIYVLGTEKSVMGPTIYVPIAVGLLGGFTTFSSFSVQTALLIEQQHISLGLCYAILSPVLGVAAAFAGLYSVRLFI
jgi:CrcB protein